MAEVKVNREDRRVTYERFPLQSLSIQGYDKTTKCGKEKYMPTHNDNRILARRNARDLSVEEFNKILGEGNSQMTQLPSIPFHPDF